MTGRAYHSLLGESSERLGGKAALPFTISLLSIRPPGGRVIALAVALLRIYVGVASAYRQVCGSYVSAIPHVFADMYFPKVQYLHHELHFEFNYWRKYAAPPLLSKSAYDFQDRFWAVFFYFSKNFSTTPNNHTTGAP